MTTNETNELDAMMNKKLLLLALAGLNAHAIDADDATAKFVQCRGQLMASIFPERMDTGGTMIASEQQTHEQEELVTAEQPEPVPEIATSSEPVIDGQTQTDSEIALSDKGSDQVSGDIDSPEVTDAAPEKYQFTLVDGPLKVRIEELMAEMFPEYTPDWNNYNANWDWVGRYEFVSEDRWEIMNEIVKTYDVGITVKKNWVLEFSYPAKRG